MNELQKIILSVSKKIGVELTFYSESAKVVTGPVYEKPFDEVADDGTYTYFRFFFKGTGYVGVLKGVDDKIRGYATMLPAYIETLSDKEAELSKTEYLKSILKGECSTLGVYKYAMKYAVKDIGCFALVLRVPKMIKEAISVIEQYGGNSLDTVVQISEDVCVLVKYVDKGENEYRSSVDYAEFLAQSLNEELGLSVEMGVGPTVRHVKEIARSYSSAEDALRYADVFGEGGNVHSYREFVLVKILEEISEGKLGEYFTDLTDEHFMEIFEDEEMMTTAEEFLRTSLNVSESSRNLYVHRNTLLYRLDKLESATGLNLRVFSDAVSFRVLTLIYRLLGK